MWEKIYGFLENNWKEIRNVLSSYILATLINAAPIGQENPWEQFLHNIDPRNSWYLVLLIIAAVLLLVLWLLKQLLKKVAYRNSIYHQLSRQMVEQSWDALDLVKTCPGYSWGADKVLLMAPDIFRGWKPEDVLVDEFHTGKYAFHKDPELAEKYSEFCNSEVYHSIVRKKNNNPRWMLTNANPNFNKREKKLFLSLRETDWCTNTFLWDYFRKDKAKLQTAVQEAFEGTKSLYPNSLCLHLVVVTADKKVLFTQISGNKRNDYPARWAVTVGEQLEKEDFAEGSDLHEQFVNRWVRRTFLEEFGVTDKDYARIVDESATSVLAVNMEADIYNFSLLTVVRLHEDYSAFAEYLNTNIVRDKEFIRMQGIPIQKIPEIMVYYRDLEKQQKQLHPSSLMRMFMCYLHFNGINQFTGDYKKAIKAARKNPPKQSPLD